MRLTEIPKGFKSLLPGEVRRREEILKKVRRIVERWGYDPISPPTIEFLELFTAVDRSTEEFAFKLVDRFTGRLMAVRPDFTPQVARIVASSFKDEEPPFRFYYSGKVFRDRDGDRETYQFGIELLGVKEVEADAEVISVVANVLKELGLKSFQIDIGHTEFLEGVVEELGVKNRGKLLNLLKHKDFSGIELFSEEEGITGKRREKLFSLLELYGKEDVLERARELFKNEKSAKALNELKSVYSILKSYGFEERVIFDLSEKRGMEYHTGITYEVFHPLYGFSLGMGGRYDQLTGKFGRELPATGIALSVDALEELLEKKGLLKVSGRKDFYIIDLNPEKRRAYLIARILREKGASVARDIVKRDYKTSVKVAFDKGFQVVIVLGKSEKSGEWIQVNFADGVEFIELDGEKENEEGVKNWIMTKILEEKL